MNNDFLHAERFSDLPDCPNYHCKPDSEKNHDLDKIGTLLEECRDVEHLRKISERLWSLLDDIDTSSDMFKPTDLDSYKRFYNYVMKKCDERSKHLESDGWNLFLPKS